jgi:predicted transcriptional regulator
MTVLDDLESFEKRVIARMQELEPLIEEYEKLEELAKRLGIDRTRRPPAKRGATTRARSTIAARATRSRSAGSGLRGARGGAAQGRRRDQVLALVKRQPGVTVPEIAKELGVDPTGLYRVVRTLQSDGQIKKEGKSLTPA